MVRANCIMLIAGCLLAVPGMVGCSPTLSPQAAALLQHGTDSAVAGDHQAVVAAMDAFLRDNARSTRADEAYYLRGLARYELGELSGADTDLAEAFDRTRIPLLKGQAADALGDLNWDRDDMPAAAQWYTKALENLPEDVTPADEAMYRLGCVLQRQGKWSSADLRFSRVEYHFRGSELARRAGRRMNARAWTIQAGAFDKRTSAGKVAQALEATKLPVQIEAVLQQGRPLFLVKVGRYAQYEQALSALPDIRRFQSDAVVSVTK